MHISLENVSVRFPIYDAKQRSFKRAVMAAATGGQFVGKSGHTVVEALHEINLEIAEGDRVALLGGNGAGKTTLLRVLAGVYHPEEGTVQVKGRVTSLLDSMLGMDLESTGYENMYLRGLFLGLKAKQIAALSDEIAEFSELGDFLNVPVRTYSSGMTLRLDYYQARSLADGRMDECWRRTLQAQSRATSRTVRERCRHPRDCNA
jgi:lipopolysaccharide transport system ATP-binding protein